jgi:hypothetical protein
LAIYWQYIAKNTLLGGEQGKNKRARSGTFWGFLFIYGVFSQPVPKLPFYRGLAQC